MTPKYPQNSYAIISLYLAQGDSQLAAEKNVSFKLVESYFIVTDESYFKILLSSMMFLNYCQACQKILMENYSEGLKKAKFPFDYEEFTPEREVNLGLVTEGLRVVELEKVRVYSSVDFDIDSHPILKLHLAFPQKIYWTLFNQ